MDMPHLSGMEILRRMHKQGMDIPVIILTGVSDVDLAVRSMKMGAFDYLTKPVDEEKLLEVMDAALEHGALHESLSRLPSEPCREDLTNQDAFQHLPTCDPAMIRLFQQAERMASSDLSIFIWGERSTGKEALARAIHKVSPRREGPFVAVNAAGQDPSRFPAALFGQARNYSGAKEESPGFLEEAAGGTLYIDEVEHLTLPVQVRLKRVIQTGEFYRESSTHIRKADVRFITASDKNPESEAYRGRFSDDLLCHLMINSIKIPALRQRPGDIPLIADIFLREALEKRGGGAKTFSPEVMEFLRTYDYPDNLQELKTIVTAAVANAEGPQITIDSLPPYVRDRTGEGVPADRRTFQPRPLTAVMREHAARTADYFGGNRAKAAAALEITPEELGELLGEG
jgi:DNA-binding NtrC family response regulator